MALSQSTIFLIRFAGFYARLLLTFFIFSFAITKVREALDNVLPGSDSEVEEGEIDHAGYQINAIRKLKAHKDRIHEELWYVVV